MDHTQLHMGRLIRCFLEIAPDGVRPTRFKVHQQPTASGIPGACNQDRHAAIEERLDIATSATGPGVTASCISKA
jgi:hypothetical protein